jgi:nitrate reductase gamma subunit
MLFVAGAAYKLATTWVMARREKVVFPVMSARFGLRSLAHWLIPLSSRNQRLHPFMTMVSYLFHFCLLLTPLFVMGHAVLWEESFLGISWWSMPPWLADVMTLTVVFAVVFFTLRRVASPEVRNVTTWKDYLLLLLVVAPFATGFLAHMQWVPYKIAIVAHIVTGTLWLALIPWTWLSHMFWFVFTRAYMGSEFGAVRNARDW